MIIGVTGKIGSGKSTVTKMLVDFGFRMINVDQLGHQALVSERERIVGAFGPEVVDDDGQIDRRHLSALIFTNVEQRHRLEEIVHPVMIRQVGMAIAESSNRVVIDAALLFPMELSKLCEQGIWVRAPHLLRLFRTLIIDGKQPITVLRTMWAQHGRALKRAPAGVDTICVSCRNVYNVAGRTLLRRQIEVILGL